jgi:hypothetical protein
MLPILTLIPTAARLAWMIGAMPTIGGKDDGIVIVVSKPLGNPASASSAFALAGSAFSPKNLVSA